MMRRVVFATSLVLASASAGAWYERRRAQHQLPPSQLSVCCGADEVHPLVEAPPRLLEQLRAAVGDEFVLDSRAPNTASYLKGARIGQGHALAIVRPATIAECLQVVQACADAGVAVIPQGANTGLTGGSVPRDDAGRVFVVVNMRRMTKITPLNDGKQVLAFSGAGIQDLANVCGYFNRESHSQLGSFFLNPSVGAGVALGSGGTQLRKGPVYTERALYIRVNEQGRAELVDALGLVASSQEDLVRRLEGEGPLEFDPRSANRVTHDAAYGARLCEPDNPRLSRFNADTHGIDAVRSEGKVLILASVHSTFPKARRSQLVWVACKDFDTAHRVRSLCLEAPADMPSTLEYMDRDTFDVADRAGRAWCKGMKLFGAGERLPQLWRLKIRIEALPLPYFDRIVDKMLYIVNPLLPVPLPAHVHASGLAFDNHVLVQIDDFGDGSGSFERLTRKLEAFAVERGAEAVRMHWLSPEEAALARTFRFACAPAFRTYCVGRGLDGISIDYALPLNYREVPPIAASPHEKRMRYSHFGCAVVHEDIAYKRLVAPVDQEKHAIKGSIEALGGALPAEHGHGVEYAAPAPTRQRLRAMDPTNTFNPGVAGDTPAAHYGSAKKQH